MGHKPLSMFLHNILLFFLITSGLGSLQGSMWPKEILGKHKALVAEPKNWLQYVKKLLLGNICKFVFQSKGPAELNFNLNYKDSRTKQRPFLGGRTGHDFIKFVQSSKTKLLDVMKWSRVNEYSTFRYTSTKLDRHTDKTDHQHEIITKPVGVVVKQIDLYGMPDNMKRPVGGKAGSHSLLFFLHRNLRLNITFDRITIFLGDLHKCFIGSVSVFYSGFRKFISFCGVHSNMVCYPPSSQVELRTIFVFQVLFDIQVSFSVMDPNFVVSQDPTRFSVFPQWIFKIIKSHLYVEKYFIKEKKYNILHILLHTSMTESFEIHDGPGILSPLLKPVRADHYLTSTFQCEVYLWIYVETIEAKPSDLLSYSAQSTPWRKMVYLTSNTQTMLFNSSKIPSISGVLFLSITALVPAAKIIITVSNLSYTGTNDLLCTFSGLSVYDTIPENTNEISNLCFTWDGVYQYPSIISKSPKLFLIVYDNDNYGCVAVQFTAKTTHCTSVVINACAFSFLCEASHNALCSEFQKETETLDTDSTVGQTIDGQMAMAGTPGLRPSYFKFSVEPEQCLILQLRHKLHKLEELFDQWFRCRIDQIQHSFEANPTTLQHSIKGFVYGELVKSSFPQPNTLCGFIKSK